MLRFVEARERVGANERLEPLLPGSSLEPDVAHVGNRLMSKSSLSVPTREFSMFSLCRTTQGQRLSRSIGIAHSRAIDTNLLMTDLCLGEWTRGQGITLCLAIFGLRRDRTRICRSDIDIDIVGHDQGPTGCGFLLWIESAKRYLMYAACFQQISTKPQQTSSYTCTTKGRIAPPR